MVGKTLIIDDDPSNRLLLRYALKKQAEAICEAASGQEALSLIAEHSFDLVLLDLELPDTTGLELLVELRRRSDKMTIIISTASDNPVILDRCCQQGADAYIIKPFEMWRVVPFIESLHDHPTPSSPPKMLVLDGRFASRVHECRHL